MNFGHARFHDTPVKVGLWARLRAEKVVFEGYFGIHNNSNNHYY